MSTQRFRLHELGQIGACLRLSPKVLAAASRANTRHFNANYERNEKSYTEKDIAFAKAIYQKAEQPDCQRALQQAALLNYNSDGSEPDALKTIGNAVSRKRARRRGL